MGRARKNATRRWWVLPLALGLAAAAGLVLMRGLGGPGSGPPLDDIDEASREQLERVLRDAEDVPVRPGGGR